MAQAQYPDSYYAATATSRKIAPSLLGVHRADVCVIGGGFTGLSSALHLAERGYDVVLIEGERIGWGASGRNGGQAGTGQRNDQEELESMLGDEHARILWDLAEEGKFLVRDLVAQYDIQCDLSYGHITAAAKRREVDALYRHADHMAERYGFVETRLNREETIARTGSPRYWGGLFDKTAMHLHPLNFALGLAGAASKKGVRIFEASRVTSYTGANPVVVKTADGEVRAEHLVLACNGYLGDLEPRVAGHIMPINNFVLATERLGEDRMRKTIPEGEAISDTKFVVNYFRFTSDTRLLFGGGESYRMKFPRDLKQFVRGHMLKVYPQLADAGIDYAWGGALAITLNRMPHFARLKGNVFAAHGYSGHGVVLATLAGRLIAEAVAGTAERFDLMANVPTPRFPGGTLLRWPGLVAGMLYYSLRDRL